ncbi:MAG: OmpA family protein [Bacteroidales bacterium]|nr:OmpA family protein [Bacteroidales bacterium]
MKKQLFLIGLILAVFTGYSQDIDDEMVTKQDSMVVDSMCHHRVNIFFGGGFTNNFYNRFDGIKYSRIHPSVHSIEIGYAYFFDKHWGIGLGVGLQRQSARANMNFSGVIPNAADLDYYNQSSLHQTNYDLLYETKNLIERQTIWAVEVPLTAQFQHFFNERNGLYATLGVRGYFPIFNRSKIVDGSLVTTGWDEFYHAYWQHEYCVGHGFDEYTIEGNGSAKLRCSVDLEANFGGLFRINNKVDFYVGLFCNYGFLDILPKAENRHNFVEPTDNAYYFAYNGLLGSNADILNDQYVISNYPASQDGSTNILRENVIGNFKWHNLQVGVKLGISIKPCGQVEPSDRKKFYRKMTEAAQKYLDDTCNACDKNTEYIYIVPVCPDSKENGGKLTKKDKEKVQALAEDLEKIKILFDLDKDVPKINESGDFIDKAAKKLKADKNLVLVIEGYTCKLGPEEHNRDLAQRRAESIKRLFVEEKGVSPDQLELHTYTTSDPENNNNITDPSLEEHRAAIIRIKVRE